MCRFNKKVSIVALIGVAVLAGSSLKAAEVSTEIELSGGSSYFHEEHHPTKFDADSFTFCSGGNSKSNDDTTKDTNSVRYENRGTDDLYNNLDGDLEKYNHFLNQSTEWENTFNDGTYTFNIKFKKRVGTDYNIKRKKPCNTKKWTYRVDQATSKVETRVKLVVPDNVWVLELGRIIKKGNGKTALPNVKVIAKKVYIKIRNREEFQQHESVELRADRNQHLFFVKPGEEIEVATYFSDDNRDIDLIGEIKVKFYGFNGCGNMIQGLKAKNKLRPEQALTSEIISDNLRGSIFSESSSSLLSAQGSKSLELMACLTSEEYVSSVIYQNNIEELDTVLEAIEDRLQTAKIEVLKTKRGGDLVVFFEALSNMARYAISRSVLNYMEPLCRWFPVYNDNEVIGYKTAYVYFWENLSKLRHFLYEADDNGLRVDRFAAHYRDILGRFERFKGTTYAEQVATIKPELKSLGMLLNPRLLKDKYEILDSLYNRIPLMYKGKALVEYMESFETFGKAVNIYEIVLKQRFMSWGEQRPVEFEYDKLENATNDLISAYNVFVDKFDRVYAQFSEKYSESYSDKIYSMSDQHNRRSEAWLSDRYQAFFSRFLTYYDTEIEANDLNRCIKNPFKGANE